LPEDAAHENDTPAWVTVATTRPETYLGDTAVAINPHDPRAKALRGLHVELPLIGRVIPIIEDSYVVLPERFARSDEEKADPKAKMATGFLKVTPAHDPNDWEIGQRHNLPVVNIFAPDATISDKHGWSDASELKGAHNFLGKKREEAEEDARLRASRMMPRTFSKAETHAAEALLIACAALSKHAAELDLPVWRNR
jgi:valyl-tRNA synthetase